MVGESEGSGVRPGAPRGAGMPGNPGREKGGCGGGGCLSSRLCGQRGTVQGERTGALTWSADGEPRGQGGLGSTNALYPLGRPGLQRPLAPARRAKCRRLRGRSLALAPSSARHGSS